MQNNKQKEMEKYMEIALELAQKGEGHVNPNPMVGAVVVKNGEIIGKGYHKYFGGPHAEVYALEEARENAEGAEIYVTLEPCSHYGKTPPCVEKVIKYGIKKCIISVIDPNPLVAGQGINKMKENGIEVITGILKNKALKQNAVFFKYIKNKIPYVFLKCAITLDGKIATRTNDSKWITNEKAREKVQKLRNKFMGIMVGRNTVINDNPRLTSRIENSNNPYRIVILPDLEIPHDYNIIQKSKEDKKTIIVTNIKFKDSKKVNEFINIYNIKFIFQNKEEYELKSILKELGKLKIDSVLIEGGSYLISRAFKENIIDEGEIFIAPKILGDEKSISFINGFSPKKINEGIQLGNIKINQYDDNVSFSFSSLLTN